MPELPDVENYRRYLAHHALGQPIAHVAVKDKRVTRGTPSGRFARALVGHTLSRTLRHGKHLLVKSGDGWLTLHFGMTGHLDYSDGKAPKFDRFQLDFRNGHHLAFVDGRRLGRIGYSGSTKDFIEDHVLGPDALDRKLTAKAFVERFTDRRGGIKAALLDQSIVAGIGNLYADELLFQAKVHPLTPVSGLTPAKLRSLHKMMRQILHTAIRSGAGSPSLYERLPKSYLIPKRNSGAECPRCHGKVKRIAAAGRSTYFCPACQKR